MFLHTADTYVVANDTVKYQGKSPSSGLEARFPPDIVMAFVGLLPAPLISERDEFHLLLVPGGCQCRRPLWAR